MTIDEPIEALIALWDANNLDSSFPGGVWALMAPESNAFPYVVITPVDEISTSYSTNSSIEQERIQFSIYYKEVASADPIVAIKTLMRTLRGVYDTANLGLIGSNAGHVPHMRFSSSQLIKESETVYHQMIEYIAVRRRPYSR